MRFTSLLKLLPFRSTSTRQSRRQQTARPARKSRRSRLLSFDILKDRLVPAIYSVIGAADGQEIVITSGRDGSAANPFIAFSLRSAIDAANASGGSNTIVFDPNVFSTFQSIPLGSPLLLSSNMTIAGPAVGVALNGQNNVIDMQVQSGVTASLSNLHLVNGQAAPNGIGGGLINSGNLTLIDCAFAGNNAASGGALYNVGNLGNNLALIDCIFSSDTAGQGGAIDNNFGTVSATGCTFVNAVAQDAGAIFNENGGTMTLTGCTLASNSANTRFGGGIDNESGGTLTLTSCTLSNNTGNDGGGGIENGASSTLTLFGCLLLDNNGGDLGGGVDNRGTATLLNSTLTGNVANEGGGIFNGSTLTVTNCTVVGNISNADGGGGIASFGNMMNLNNSIVAGNHLVTAAGPTNDDFLGHAVANFSLIESIGGFSADPGSSNDLTNVDPLLASLGSYGGPTQTMPPLPGSLAIDHGSNALAVDANPNPLLIDQRGVAFARIAHGTVDIGACEVQQTFYVSDALDETDGNFSPNHLSLREAVQLASLDPGPDTIAFDAGMFSTHQTITLSAGQLELREAVTITGPNIGVTIDGNGQSRAFLVDAGVTASLSNLTLIDCNAGSGFFGGALLNYGTLTVTNCTLTGDTSSYGGALDNAPGATLTVDHCVISNNTSLSPGGGIANDGTLTVTSSTVSGNTAISGGGVYNTGTLTLFLDTLSGNTANVGGGGLDNLTPATLIDCTLTGNSANYGGGLRSSWPMTVTNCTIANNSAGTGRNGAGGGGGIYGANGQIALANTIVAGNINVFPISIPDDISGVVTAFFSLIGKATFPLTSSSANNIIGKDPLLAPLGFHGGPTFTMPLLPGSPAIDQGSNVFAVDGNGNPLVLDQRGFSRLVNGRVDLGATEFLFDLGISLNSMPAVVTSGGVLDYVATVTNLGPDTATGVVVAIPLPAGTTLAAWVTPRPGWTLTTQVQNGQTVAVATLMPGQTLAAGFSVTFTLVVRVTATSGSIPGTTATVSAPAWEFNANNNTATATAVSVQAPGSSTAPAATTLSGATGTLTTQTPTFTWTAVSGAAHYDLWVDDLTTGQGQVVRLPNIVGTTLALPSFQALTPGHSYRWWIGTVASTGLLTWSAVQTFSIAPLAAPTASGPSGPISVDQPIFTWTPVTGADHYYLWVNDLSTGQSQVVNLPNVTGTTLTLSAAQALTPGHSYQWWIGNASINGQAISWSSSLTFNITPLAAPTASSPTGTISMDQPTFRWLTMVGADHYNLWVNDLTTGQSQVVSLPNLTGASVTLTAAQALTPGHSYQWWIGAVSTNGLATVWSSAQTFAIAALQAPTLTSPAGTTVSQMPTLFWTGGNGAHYDLWINDLTTNQSQVVRLQNLNPAGFSVQLKQAQALTPGHSYQWWIGSVSTNGLATSWSNSQTFTIAALPAPTPGIPAGTITTVTPTFSWSTVADADHYYLWVNDLTTGQNQVVNLPNLTGTQDTLTAAQALTNGHQYEWWIGSVSSNGLDIAWSNGQIFTI